jgi:hemoglobin-like flavoprotein
MQLTWIPERGRYVSTQGEAKSAKEAFEVQEISTAKPEFLVWINELLQKHDEEKQSLKDSLEQAQARIEELEKSATVVSEPVEEKKPAKGFSTKTREEPVVQKDLMEQILDLDADGLAPVLSAALSRLGEVANTRGWAAFGTSVYSWSPGARSVERGLGMLMLAALDSLPKR